ncbi:hypothetical protein ACFE04_011251 [Oxalis oulophora]
MGTSTKIYRKSTVRLSRRGQGCKAFNAPRAQKNVQHEAPARKKSPMLKGDVPEEKLVPLVKDIDMNCTEFPETISRIHLKELVVTVELEWFGSVRSLMHRWLVKMKFNHLYKFASPRDIHPNLNRLGIDLC